MPAWIRALPSPHTPRPVHRPLAGGATRTWRSLLDASVPCGYPSSIQEQEGDCPSRGPACAANAERYEAIVLAALGQDQDAAARLLREAIDAVLAAADAGRAA